MRGWLLFATLFPIALSTVFNYKLHESNDEEVNRCVANAIEQIQRETCLFWEDGDEDGDPVTFLQSGHCSWQASNKTVHLSPNCITDDTCFEILGKVADIEQPRRHISRHINIKFNCTEKCTTECQNGGVLDDECKCSCQYGFKGDNCEKLSRAHQFTDTTCGVIKAQQSGNIALSTHPDNYHKQTFCQWQIKTEDPWDVIELSFDDFDLDNDELPPGQHCNDLFYVYGAYGVENPIPCDGERPRKMRSESNWLLIELRTNPFSEKGHKGPEMRYQVVNTKSGIKTLSEEQTSVSTAVLSSLLPIAIAALRLL
ncbi:unnamed protein product, partial [Mesorhabditis belari]|uniref:CUB domain-containing protein n=1 Tax=Mesorhabditis belari TaxID=2138241 RepID=A0AAF3EB48_9BILA